MKRKALLLIFTAAMALATPVFAQDVFLIGFTGFDYEDADNNATYLDVGEGYKAVGFVTSVGPLLDPYYDPSTYEYTFHMYDLTVGSRFFGGGVLEVYFNNGGRGRYYEDAGTAASYGINPPNATAPSTFTDGGLLLGGSIDNFVLTYDFNFDQGNFVGQMNLDEGSALVYVPAGQRNGWHLGGLAGRPNATVPDGYDNQIEGECRIPDATPTTTKTWGSIQALYR